MTYTFKLSRRLALSKHGAALSVLALAACMGEATGPDTNNPALPAAPIALRVIPSAVTIETNQRIRFRGESQARRGEVYAAHVAWESSGGTIDSIGNFIAKLPGTYKVVGRGRGRGRQKPDTSIVVVVPPQPNVVAVQLSPESASIEAGATYRFAAVGQLSDGTTAAIGVTWTAAGGTIDASGLYTAGPAAGAHRVIARNLEGTLADTAAVTVTVTVPEEPEPPADPETPEPPPAEPPETPAPTPTLTVVHLKPATAALGTGTTKQFRVYGIDSAGDSVAVPATFTATGGTITPDGLYTGGGTAGTFRVIAKAGQLADTAVVTLTRTLGGGTVGTGIPVGLSGLFSAGVEPAPYTMSLDAYNASTLVSRLSEARNKKLKLLMNMTGGSHSNYLTDGAFDMAKWKAKMDTYNTATIKQAVAAAVADGTIIGNAVMDEPHNTTPSNTWGPPGTMTKAKVDQLCGYVKNMFPTLPVGVVHDHRVFEPDKNYAVCDFVVAQYRLSKGPIDEYREGGLAFARRSGIAISFSLNILHGGDPSTTCAKYGDDPGGTLCPMTADQMKRWGLNLGTASCALNMWRYEPEYFYDAGNQQALRVIADSMARLPRKACLRP